MKISIYFQLWKLIGNIIQMEMVSAQVAKLLLFYLFARHILYLLLARNYLRHFTNITVLILIATLKGSISSPLHR